MSAAGEDQPFAICMMRRGRSTTSDITAAMMYDENRRPALAGSVIQHVPEGHQQRRCALCRVQHAVVRDRELPAEHVGAGRRDQLGGWPETAQAASGM